MAENYLSNDEYNSTKNIASLGKAVDGYTGSVANMSTYHAMIHKGRRFIMANELALTIGSEKWIILYTGNAVTHLDERELILDTSKLQIDIYEDIDVSAMTLAEGDLINRVNLNRMSDNNSIMQIWNTTETPVLTDAQHLFKNTFIGADVQTGGRTIPTMHDEEYEWVLKNNSYYGIRYTNTGASDIANFVQRYWWYEMSTA